MLVPGNIALVSCRRATFHGGDGMTLRFLHQWEDLLATAIELQALRASGDPKAVAGGRLTVAEATDRTRRAAALVAQWRHVVDRTPFDIDDPLASLGASWAELRTDLAAALTRAEARAAASPDSRPLRDFADAVAALHWHQQPQGHPGQLPHIVRVHDFNQALRRQREDRQARAA